MTSGLPSEWHLSADGINIITENGSIKELNKILINALNTDLKEIGNPVLTNELSKERTSKIVLQIQKIRNIAAPKANENSQAAPRMLKLNLTDGDSHIQALEISTINSISRDHTPPGTKILINNAKISTGYILLTPNNCTILGGKVPHLHEKWEFAKSIQRNKRRNSCNDDGPPPWVNFGVKIQTGDQEANFKSLGNKNKDAKKDNSEFELQRQGAIAEASSGAVRKVFGGRVKQNVQPIANNSQKERQERNKSKPKPSQKEREIEGKPSKPSEKVSLFAFLEDKLPLSDNQNTAKYINSSESQNYYQGNSSKISESQSTLYSNPQKEYQNYNHQNKKDYKQGSYNKNELLSEQNNRPEKASVQRSVGQYSSPKQLAKPQSSVPMFNNYSKPYYRQNNVNSNVLPKPYENLQQQRRNDNSAFNSKTSQSSDNIQKDKDVSDLTNSVNKLSLNSQFASRSLRQHLNLGPPRKSEEIAQNVVWNIGDECMAKYWEDGKFYHAIITAVTDKTYAVKFKGYGNIEEILKTDCLPVTTSYNKEANRNNSYGTQNQQYRRPDYNNKPYPGSMEFRRSTRNYK